MLILFILELRYNSNERISSSNHNNPHGYPSFYSRDHSNDDRTPSERDRDRSWDRDKDSERERDNRSRDRDRGRDSRDRDVDRKPMIYNEEPMDIEDKGYVCIIRGRLPI